MNPLSMEVLQEFKIAEFTVKNQGFFTQQVFDGREHVQMFQVA